MLGAVVGDLVGSIYERKTLLDGGQPLMTAESRFTDDTVFTLAVAEALLTRSAVSASFRRWATRYPEVGASKRFTAWLQSGSEAPYGGDTNGCLMRVSPAIFLAKSEHQAVQQALHVTVVTHDSAIALAAVEAYAKVLWRALDGAPASEVRSVFQQEGLSLRAVADIHAAAKFRMRADDTLEDVYACLSESHDFESMLRNCLRCGGDVDTLCAVAGPVAEALWGVPEELGTWAVSRLPADVRVVLASEYQAVERLAHMRWHGHAVQLLASAG